MMRVISSVVIVSFFLLCHCKPDEVKPDTDQILEKKIEKDSTHNFRYLTGQFDPSNHPLFEKIDIKYADRENLFMRKEAYQEFQKMWEAAKEDGVSLQIRSATRNFDYQKGIWERKWEGITTLSDGSKANEINSPRERALKILLYSSMPGTSRHHWGTDIDLNSFDNNWFESGEGLVLYNWLLKNAGSYGYYQVYTSKGEHRPYGYEEEKWHWSFKPISGPLTSFAEENIANEMITGFQGAETSTEIDVVGKYILGVDPKCR